VASGVNAETYLQLRSEIGDIDEIHLSASSAVIPECMEGRQDKGEDMGFGGPSEWTLDKAKLEAFMNVIRGEAAEQGGTGGGDLQE
jgi:hypothetical protein